MIGQRERERERERERSKDNRIEAVVMSMGKRDTVEKVWSYFKNREINL